MNVNDRIKEIRKGTGLTADAFGKRIGVSQQTISGVENGTRKATQRIINDICREFGISEAWILTGEGDPKAIPTKNQEIADLAADLYALDGDSLRYRFIITMSQMSDAEITMVYEMAKRLCEGMGFVNESGTQAEKDDRMAEIE